MVDHQAIFVRLVGWTSVGIIDDADLLPTLRAWQLQQRQEVDACIHGVAALAGQYGHVSPEARIIDARPPMPCIHAVADRIGVYAVALRRLIGVGLPIPGVGLFAF